MDKMEKRLTPELKKLKEEFDFLHKKIGDLQWEKAIRFYGKKAIFSKEIEVLDEQLDNYIKNINILIDKIEQEVSRANKTI